MRNLQLLFVVILGFSPLFLFSQPKLLELIPSKVYTQNVIPSAYNTIEMEYKEGDIAEYISVDIPLELKIENLSAGINASNFQDKVKIFLKKGSQFEQATMSSWNFTSLTVPVKSGRWLTNDTPVEVYVEAEGIRTNTIFLIIVDPPQVPPTVTSLNRNRVTITKEPLSITITGKNFGQEVYTGAKINGIPCDIINHNYMNGWMEVLVPQAVREAAGTYSVIVGNIYGKSNAVNLIVEKPLVKMAPVALAAVPRSSAQQENNLNKAQPKIAVTGSVVASGILIYLNGTTSAANKTYLEDYIRQLDQVKKIENNFSIDNSEKVSIKLKGIGVPRVTMDHVKLSIENKLRALRIAGEVVFE